MKHRTANSTSNELRLSAAICTANMAGVANGEWALISPFGDHPSPDGSYAQRFDRQQAAEVVKTWNSITGKAARVFKNLWHGLGAKFSAPAWDGHPETDQQRWPIERLLAEITDLRVGADGLEGRVTWNAKGSAARTRGPLYPSALWWHLPPAGSPPFVFPELLESVGLVTAPNISGVPAWTANANPFAGNPQAENQTENPNPMNEEQLKALRTALGLPENADADTCINGARTANTAALKLVEDAAAIATANSAKAELETQLSTANGQVTTLTAERDTLTTANSGLTAAVETLRNGVLDLAEKRGAITPAERPAFAERLNTANTVSATVTELSTRKAMNTQAVEINGNRVDLSTANARGQALQDAIAARMKADDCEYGDAFAAVKRDPKFSALFAAMQDPTSKAA